MAAIAFLNSCDLLITTTSTTPPPPYGFYLTWNTSEGATGYIIQRETGPSIYGPWTEIASVPAENPRKETQSYWDPTVEAGQAYCYRVRAFSSEGMSGWGETTCVNSEDTQPLPPIALSAELVHINGVKVTWKNNSKVARRIVIERTSDINVLEPVWTPLELITWEGDRSTDYFIDEGDPHGDGTYTPLEFNTRYYYRVHCLDSSDTPSTYSNLVTVVTGFAFYDGSTLVPPSPLGASPVSGRSAILLTWNPVTANVGPDAGVGRGFLIQLLINDTGLTQVWADLARVTSSQSSWEHIDLLAGEIYTYRIASYNGDNISIFSDRASATAEETTDSYLPIVSNVSAVFDAATQRVQVTWTQSWTDDKHTQVLFDIHRWVYADATTPTSANDFDLTQTVVLGVTSFSDSGHIAGKELASGSYYVYGVKAVGAGTWSKSNRITVTTVASLPPSPTDVNAYKDVYGVLVYWSDYPPLPSGQSFLHYLVQVVGRDREGNELVTATYTTTQTAVVDTTFNYSQDGVTRFDAGYTYLVSTVTQVAAGTDVRLSSEPTSVQMSDLSISPSPDTVIEGELVSYNDGSQDDTYLKGAELDWWVSGAVAKKVQNSSLTPGAIFKKRVRLYWQDPEPYRQVWAHLYTGDTEAFIHREVMEPKQVMAFTGPFPRTLDIGFTNASNLLVEKLHLDSDTWVKTPLVLGTHYTTNLSQGQLTLDPTAATSTDIVLTSFRAGSPSLYSYQVKGLTSGTFYSFKLYTSLFSNLGGDLTSYTPAYAVAKTWEGAPPCVPDPELMGVTIVAPSIVYICWQSCNNCYS